MAEPQMNKPQMDNPRMTDPKTSDPMTGEPKKGDPKTGEPKKGGAPYESGTEQVQAWLDATTLHIRFNNPQRHNALSVDMWAAVPPLLQQASADERVRLVVFSGAGEKAFVSGADISQFEDMRAAREAVRRYEALAEKALMSIHDFAKPTLACIRGWCIGGGVNVAISCDIRIASADSIFSIPAARLGLGYRYSAMKNLVDLIGPGDAFRISRVIALPAATVSGALRASAVVYSASSASRPSGGQTRDTRPSAFASAASMRRAVKNRSLAAPGPIRSTRFFIAE